MRSIEELSDSELQALYAGPAVIQQESRGRPGALGPQTRYGRAEGMTQMLPATAKQMAEKLGEPWRPELMRGTSPEAAAYQERLGLAYLQEGIEKTGSLDGAFKYYHGGPDQRLWGPKTNRYAQEVSARLTGGAAPHEAPDLTGLSNDELLAMYQQGGDQPDAGPAVSVEVAGRPDLGRGEYTPPVRPQGPPANAPRKVARPGAPFRPSLLPPAMQPLVREVVADLEDGFMEPLRTAYHAPGQYLRDAGKNDMDGFLAPPRLVGSVVGAAAAPMQAIARAGAGQLSKIPTYDSSWPSRGAPRRLTREEAKTTLEGDLMTALSAAMPARARAPQAAPRPKPLSVEQLETAKRAAYAKADNLGVRYNAEDFARLVDDLEVKAIKANLDPDLHKGAVSVLKTFRKRADAGQAPTLTDMDSLRKVIDRDAIKPGGPDETFGMAFKDALDNFVNNADQAMLDSGSAPKAAAAIREARRLNTQYMKAKAVTEAVESADLRAQSTYSGGNLNNAIRQNIRPLVDPRSKQRVKNFTPKELAAAKRVVKGSLPQNAMRTAGKLLDPRGIVGMGVQAAMGVGTGGASLPSAVLGAAATEIGSNMTQGNVRKLLNLIGSAPRVPTPKGQPLGGPAFPGPRPRALSGPGAVGLTEVATPLPRILAEQEARRKAKAAPRRKRR